MTHDEMIQALEEVMQGENDRDGFFTSEELSQLMGLSEQSVRKRLRAAQRLGRLEQTEFRKPNLRGYIAPHTAYRIVPG